MIAATGKQLHQLQTIRWKSDKGEKDVPTKPVAATNATMTTEGTAASSTATTPMTEKFEQRIKRVVDELNIGDQLSVILIAVLTAVILAAPMIVRQMKQSDTEDYSVASEDPVDGLTTVIRRAWNGDDLEEDEGSKRSAVESFLKEMLQSKGLQQAAQQFVVQILESPAFKAALGRLVNELWTDLSQDPETVAQVIRILQIAIQNPAVKDAAQKLVIDLVNEPDVKDALIGMIQELGADQQVLDVTQSIITEAAHNSLNDPEILDHSMEFATDVVGDDLVQRTAGEALRKSVGHAVRPATTVFLTATGVGLLIFGVAAIGYARSSDQEAVLFETAARSLQTNATNGIVRFLTWPGRAVVGVFEQMKVVFFMPVEWLHECVVLAGKKTGEAVLDAVFYMIALPGRGIDVVGRGIASVSRSAGQAVSTTVTSFNEALVSAVVNFVQRSVAHILAAIQNVFRSSSDAVMRVTKKGYRTLSAADEKVLDFYARLLVMIESLWRQIVSSNYYFR
jgi:hypothetical protein